MIPKVDTINPGKDGESKLRTANKTKSEVSKRSILIELQNSNFE